VIGWVSGLARGAFIATTALSGAAALLHLVSIDYPATTIFAGLVGRPFSGDPALAFGALLAAIAVTGVLVPAAWPRAGLAALAGIVAVYVLPFELSDTPLVGSWAALAAVGLILDHRVVAPRLAGLGPRRTTTTSANAAGLKPAGGIWLAAMAGPAFLAVALLAGACAIGHLFAFEYPPTNAAGYDRATPFLATQAAAFASVLVALAAVGALVRVAWVRVGLTALAGLLALWVFPFELSGPALVLAWAALTACAYVVEARLIQPRAGDAFTGDSSVPALRGALRPAVRGLGALTGMAMVVHLVSFDFPINRLRDDPLSATPFLGPEGASLAAILAALAVSGWVMGQRWIRLAMSGIGLALVIYATGFEIPRPHAAAAWALLALLSLAIVRRLVPIRLLRPRMALSIRRLGERTPFAAAALAVLFILGEGLILATPAELVRHVAWIAPPVGTLFVDERTYVLGVLGLTWLAAGAIWGVPRFLIRGGVAAGLVVAWLLPFEVRPAYAVAGWLALASVGLWVSRPRPVDRLLVAGAAVGLAILATAVDLAVVAPPGRLVVDAVTTVDGWRFLTDSTVGLGALTLALGFAAWIGRTDARTRWVQLAAGVIGVYLLSVTVVDWFQWDVVIGARPMPDLASDAQVGLSVVWAATGGLAFAAGIISGHPRVRLFGLGLLGMAAVKVFLFDLVGMPIESRVAVLIALGVLLLLSAFVYARIQQPHGRPPMHA